LRSVKYLSVGQRLIPASIVISLRTYGEWTVPLPLNVVLMTTCVSWHAALYLLINWWLWNYHYPALYVHETDSPHSGHAYVSANLYMYASLPLYSWPHRKLSMVMPFFGDLQM